MRLVSDTAVAADSGAASGLPPLADSRRLAAQASLWDRRDLVDALGDGSAAERPATGAAGDQTTQFVEAAPVGWTLLDGRLTALIVRRPVASSERWRLFVADATRPVLRDSLFDPFAGLDDDARGAWPLVGPGLDGARLLDGRGASDVPGASLLGRRARVAHAWALRDAAILDADSGGGFAPLLVTHRDVRDRVRRLAPVFVQGGDVLPVRDGDRVYWALQLYSASAHYPLSQRWLVDDQAVGYFKLAATALVDAATGRVQLVPSPRPDAVARTWMTRLPTLFTPASALPPGLADQLPPATESAIVQLRTFARYGSRLDGPVTRRVPDSLITRGAPPPVVVTANGREVLGWSVPLLDRAEVIEGVATVLGGATRATWWHPAGTVRHSWRVIVEQLQAVADSARSGSQGQRRDAKVRRSPPVVVMTERGLLAVESVQWLRPDGGTVIARVGVTDGQRAGVGSTLAEALTAIGASPRPGAGAVDAPDPAGPLADDAGRLYDAMRRALQRGNWSAFGAAFDSLGMALRRPPP